MLTEEESLSPEYVRSILSKATDDHQATLFLFDHDLRYIFAGGPALQKLGFENFTGKTLRETLPRNRVEKLEPLYRQCLAGEDIQFQSNYADQCFSSMGAPLRDNTGRIIGGFIFSLRTPTGESSAYQASHILIVDDDPINRAVLSKMILGENGLIREITTAVDGRNALERIRSQRPDLVLTDIYMPNLNGIEAARQIQAMYVDLPIIAMTSQYDSETREKAFAAGVSEVLEKPVSLQRLLSILRDYLPRRPV